MKHIDHRAEAEQLLASADTAMAAALEKTLPIEDQQHAAVLAALITNRALGHSLLARNEDDAATRADMRDANTLLRNQLADVKRLLDDHIADALTGNNPYSWYEARELARNLDAVGLNIDNAIDERLAVRGIDPAWAWKHPSSRICRDGHSWIDLTGHVHDLNKAYIAQDGTRWTWTKKVDDRDGHPIFTSKQKNRECDLDVLLVFGAKPEGDA